MGYQVGSTEVISPTRVLKNVTIDPSVPISLPTYVVRTTFTGSGTFTKDANDLFYMVEVWGAGASGGKYLAGGIYSGQGGGAGGGYNKDFFVASDITGPVTVTVGAGGIFAPTPAPPSFPSGIGYPVAGGNSSFGTYLVAQGGQQSSGGYGFVFPPAAPAIAHQAAQLGHFASGGSVTGFNNGYYGGADGADPNGFPASGTPPRIAGVSFYGGGGGGARPAPSPASIGTGGISIYGGNGGNYPGGNGNARGGGGAELDSPLTPASGQGGRGEVRITAWRK